MEAKIGYIKLNSGVIYKISELNKKANGTAIRDCYSNLRAEARTLKLLHERLYVLRCKETEFATMTDTNKKILKCVGLDKNSEINERADRLEQILELAIIQLENGADLGMVLKILKQNMGEKDD